MKNDFHPPGDTEDVTAQFSSNANALGYLGKAILDTSKQVIDDRQRFDLPDGGVTLTEIFTCV